MFRISASDEGAEEFARLGGRNRAASNSHAAAKLRI